MNQGVRDAQDPLGMSRGEGVEPDPTKAREGNKGGPDPLGMSDGGVRRGEMAGVLPECESGQE